MNRRLAAVVIIAAVALAALTSVPVWSREGYPNSIMTPEPWLAPRYKSPRGLKQRVRPIRQRPVVTPDIPARIAQPAPPTVVPGLRPIPNLAPIPRGYVPGGGVETFQDRAVRCTHQMGVFNVPGQQASSYMHNCTMN